MIGRRGLLAGLGATMATGTGGAAYALGVEPYWRLAVERHAFTPSDWPEGLGLRVVMLADLHAGAPIVDEARIEQIVAATNGLSPDLVLLLGDYGPSTSYVTRALPHADVARRLAALRAPFGVHAVMGNHDWWEDPAATHGVGVMPAIGRAFERAGINVLQNDVVRAGPVLVGGLDSAWAYAVHRGADDLPRLLGRVTGDAPLLLMAHEPDCFATMPQRVAVTFSGHTHGGQVRLLGWSPIVPSIYGNRYAWGRVQEHGRDLVVSGGLGISTYPIRFGVPPEITVVDLGTRSEASYLTS